MAPVDVASLQLPWMHSNALITDFCVRHGTPFMITAHGTFHPEALRISSWKKRLASRTFLRDMFGRAACFQALTEEEAQHIRAAGIRKPVCVIGNGVALPTPLQHIDEGWLPESLRDHRICLFLGRLHPIKGLERLIAAWARFAPPEWRLVLVGTGEAGFVATLKRLAETAAPGRIFFAGPAYGDQKSAWIGAAELLVLPSFSEALPMTVLEGLAHGRPSLLTNACGLGSLARQGALFEVDNNAEAIGAGLATVLKLSAETLRIAGDLGRLLVQEHYSWDAKATQLEEVYRWMLGGPTPDTLCLA